MKIEHNTQALAIDPNQIAGIQANSSDGAKLEAAAEQFEAIFLQLVLKNMQSATTAIAGESSLLHNNQQQMIQQMHDAQISQSIAQQKQLGFAEQIVHQLASGLGDVENKFKLLADAAAVSNTQSSQAPVVNAGPAFSSPLWTIPGK